MRKVTQFLINKFGGQVNSAANVMVSQWFSHSYALFDMSVSLRDVNDDYLVRQLQNVIEDASLDFDDLKHVAIIPALSSNNRDLLVKIIALPALLEKLLKPVVSVTYGFWSEHDKVIIKDSSEHILVKPSKKKGELNGLYLNGLMDSGEKCSFYFNKDELDELLRVANCEKFNGVIVQDEALLMSIVTKSIFLRLIDSDIGYHIEMGSPDIYTSLKNLVWPSVEPTASAENVAAIYSSWGAKIGVAYQQFTIVDAKKAETSPKPQPKRALAMVVNNDADETEVSSDNSAEEDVCQDWGRF